MADLYGVTTTKSQNVLNGLGKDKGPSSSGEFLKPFKDTYVLATASWANGDVLSFGPFRAGEKLVAEGSFITGDGTVDLGDDVDIGWEYADGSSGDVDAFATAADMSATNIDGAGLAIAGAQTAYLEPPTNDRLWYLTLSPDDVTGEAAGTCGVSLQVVSH